MIACLNQATTLPTPFAEDVAAYADGGCTGLEVWLTKLEQHLEQSSVAATRALLEERGVRLVAAAYQGGLLLSQGTARTTHFDHFKRRLDLCQTFGIPTMVVVADFVQRFDPAVLPHAVASLAEAGQWAAGFGVDLALEFRGADTFCSSLDTAITLVEQCGEANVGICLDLFHFYKGPSKTEDLLRLTPANLFHVQLCDVAGVPREWMTDADRVFPGEGDFALDPLRERLQTIGYHRGVSVELMNPTLWQLKPSQVAELAWTTLQRFLVPTTQSTVRGRR